MGGASSPDPVPLSSQKAEVEATTQTLSVYIPLGVLFCSIARRDFRPAICAHRRFRQRRRINFAADRSWIYRVIPLIRRRLRVSCLIQPQKTARLELDKCWALPSPQAPAPVRYACVQTPAWSHQAGVFSSDFMPIISNRWAAK